MFLLSNETESGLICMGGEMGGVDGGESVNTKYLFSVKGFFICS